MSKWTSHWPKKPGIYLFYGYIVNKGVEAFPRLHLVTVEYVSDIFGAVYRTGRYSIKRGSGAYGMWKPIDVPDLPELNESAASNAAKNVRPIRKEEVSFE
jgi:hypothetical protein